MGDALRHASLGESSQLKTGGWRRRRRRRRAPKPKTVTKTQTKRQQASCRKTHTRDNKRGVNNHGYECRACCSPGKCNWCGRHGACCKAGDKSGGKCDGKHGGKGKFACTDDTLAFRGKRTKARATTKQYGNKINRNVRLDRCVPYNGKTGTFSCERGLIKCVTMMGKQVGCIGAAAYAYLNKHFKGLGASAEASAGFRLEFFKWTVALFETDNKASINGGNGKGSINAYANYFNIASMKKVSIYSFNRKMDFGFQGSNCKANQEATGWVATKKVKKRFFKKQACYGIPKIAAICGSVILEGEMRLRMAFGVATPGGGLVVNLTPGASLTISLQISGQLLGFKGYLRGGLTLVDA